MGRPLRFSCRSSVNRHDAGTFNKEGGLPPSSGASNAASVGLVLIGDQQPCDRSDVGDCFGREGSTCCQVLFIAQWSRMICRKEAGRSEAIEQLFKVRGARENVVVQIQWIQTESITVAEFDPGPWQDLHQSHCAMS